MKKSFLSVAAALVFTILAPSGIVEAQNAQPNPRKVNPELLKMSGAEKEAAKKALLAKYPLLFKEKELHPQYSAFPMEGRSVVGFVSKRKAGEGPHANPNTIIWGNLNYKRGWTQSVYGPFGYYSFNPTDPIDFKTLYETDERVVAKNGVQYKNGHIYGVNVDMTYASSGFIMEDLYDTDTSTGETNDDYLDFTTDLGLAALETAQAADGTVYGEFYSGDGSSFEWGTVDYSTKHRTTIGPAKNRYVALGITKEGQLYGIAIDGNLYKIDKSNGNETLVGPTGLTLVDDKGTYFGQSGEIDQRDNTFYWAALQNASTGGLYVVDLETGAATLVSEDNTQVYGMIIPQPDAPTGAPAKITDAALHFEGASLTGTVSFTAPSTTYGGDALTGSVDYTIKANDNVVATGTAEAGAPVNADVTVPANGDYGFVITTSNASGESPAAKVSQWIGYDIPEAVSNITLANDNGKVTISWNAPKRGLHDATLGSFTYDVYRIANGDTTKVASDITETTFVDDITGGSLAYYTYAVGVKAAGIAGALASSSKGVVVGTAVEPDWKEDFTQQADYNFFTILDVNGDKATWRFNSYGHYAWSNSSKNNGNDDWLITPAIHLKPGRLYTVKFTANTAYGFHNTLEVKWGNDKTPEALTNTLLATSEAKQDSVYSYDIKPTVEGNYYIGFHDNTATPNQFFISVHSIEVTKSAVDNAPQAVSDLKVTPAERGALSATISFTVPSKDVQEKTISSVDSIEIKRDGKVITTLQSAVAGSSQVYTDAKVPSNGFHTYDVIPFIGNDSGKGDSVSVFIGIDVPTKPENVSFADNTNNIIAKWNPISDKGLNGGYVNTSNVAVSFFSLAQGGYGTSVKDSITTSAKGATSVVIPQNPDETTLADGKTQVLYQLAARADGETGHSGYTVSSPIVIGPSIRLPYKESFAGGKIDNGFAWLSANDQVAGNSEAANWQLDTQTSFDGDGGSAVWHSYTLSSYYGNYTYNITPGDEVSINTPKITLDGANNPKLLFNLYSTVNDPAELEVKIQTPDGVQHLAKTFDLSTTSKEGWSTQALDLSQYKSERYIIVRFNGIAHGTDTYIGIDNVNMLDQLENNLAAVGIKAPKHATAGKKVNVKINVENLGANTANNFKVVLYADDNAVDTVVVDKSLPVIATDTVECTLPVAIDKTGDVSVKATVVSDNDQNSGDNTTSPIVITVKPSEYNKVSDLVADKNEGGVSLKWSAPSFAEPETTTEDFEGYEPFSTYLGDWTLVDGDKGNAGYLLDNYPYPGQGTAFAFEAFNPKAITDVFNVLNSNPGLTPHSGNQFAAALYANDPKNSMSFVNADNWLISPELSGRKQTVKFYAFNLASTSKVYAETFDVDYSTTDNDTTSFVKLESDVANGTSTVSQGANWKEFSVEIPEGAKYFAIHHNTEAGNSFIFGIDDVTYERVAPGANDTIVGYNVYRDGALVATVNGKDFDFVDGSAGEGQHVYNVTVLYKDSKGNINESGFSNGASIVVTGINNINADSQKPFDVYTVDGKLVKENATSTNGLPQGVYIINSKKVLIK